MSVFKLWFIFSVFEISKNFKQKLIKNVYNEDDDFYNSIQILKFFYYSFIE